MYSGGLLWSRHRPVSKRRGFSAGHLRGGSPALPFVPLSSALRRLAEAAHAQHRLLPGAPPHLAAGAITLPIPAAVGSDSQFPLPLLKRLAVPYYRITIWLKNRRKPLQGIRQIDHFNIDAVYNMIWQKARAHYNDSILVDVEVAMLPKRSTAVRNFINKKASSNF